MNPLIEPRTRPVVYVSCPHGLEVLWEAPEPCGYLKLRTALDVCISRRLTAEYAWLSRPSAIRRKARIAGLCTPSDIQDLQCPDCGVTRGTPQPSDVLARAPTFQAIVARVLLPQGLIIRQR
ncbi:hypothetical protein AcW1_007754 [Taiwanofungus camphoratus]|nr:hypothetical protein AcW1_007754 [Antrodia cinnamomea]